MKSHAIQGPKVIWRALPANSLSTKMEIFRAIVSEEQADNNFEKIVGENDLKPIAFLEQGIVVSKPVVHITLSDGGMATGFLIAADVLLTNHHVFRSEEDAKSAKIRFNFQTDFYGNALPTDEYECDPGNYFKNNEKLDYAAVRVRASPGMKWGYLKIKPIDISAVQIREEVCSHPLK